jgi:hypothetical protein
LPVLLGPIALGRAAVPACQSRFSALQDGQFELELLEPAGGQLERLDLLRGAVFLSLGVAV